MNRSDIEKLILAKPKIGIRLLEMMGQRLRESEEHLEETLFHDVPRQLAALLLRMRVDSGTDTIATTHEELAEHLGVYRETVTTALSRLKREGLVSISRRQVQIQDVDGLEARADL